MFSVNEYTEDDDMNYYFLLSGLFATDRYENSLFSDCKKNIWKYGYNSEYTRYGSGVQMVYLIIFKKISGAMERQKLYLYFKEHKKPDSEAEEQ